MRTYLRVVRVTILLAASIFVAPITAVGQEVTLRLHHFVPAGTTTHKAFLQPWADRIAAASGGRLKAEVYPSMTLGGTPQQLVDQVKDGVVDIVWTLPAYTPGRFPKTEAFELPTVISDPIATNLALQDFYDMHLQDEYKDYKVLLLHVHMGQVFHMREGKEIRSLDDLRGKTLRAPGATGTLFIEAVGAIPYQSPVTEIPQLMSKGVVDGVMIPFEIVPPYKVHELARSHTTLAGPRIHTSVFLLAMNKDSYERLPDDLQKVIDDSTGRNLATVAGQIWTDVEVPGESLARGRNNEFITLSSVESARVRQASEAAILRWVSQSKDRGFDGAQLIRDAKALLGKHQK